MANHPLAASVSQSSLGAEVELYILDCRSISGDPNMVSYFCPSSLTSSGVQWKNIAAHEGGAGAGWVEYTPIQIEGEGFEATGQGTLPRPHFRISNIGNYAAGPMSSAMQSYNDLLGATLIRYKTLSKYLKSGSEENYNAHFPPDVYQLNRKVAHNPQIVEWELAPYFDCQGLMLPRRLILRDMCQLRYRVWDSVNETWIYDDTENACPIINRSILWGETNNRAEFDELGHWLLYDNMALSSGALVKTAGATGTAWLHCSTSPDAYYYISLEITFTAGGQLSVSWWKDDVFGETIEYITTSGTKQFAIDAPAVNSWLRLHGDASSAFSIAWLEADVAWDAGNHNYPLNLKDDVCSHTLDGCKLRWPGQEMPFLGFPGVGRVRV
jgi:lambda family phage minor tail protein L